METCLNYCDKENAFFSTDEKRLINKIRRFKQRHPDEVTILAEPENNDGCIYVKLPVAVFRLQWPTKCEMTEEQLQASAERLAEARKKRLEQNTDANKKKQA